MKKQGIIDIYDDDAGLIESVPRFGDGTNGSDIIVTGFYNQPSTLTKENNELDDTIPITFKSIRSSENNKKIYKYNILAVYERVVS